MRQLPFDPRHADGEQQQRDQESAIRGRALYDDGAPARLQAVRRVPPRRARRNHSSPRTTRSSKARSAARTATTRTARSSRRACATTRSSTCASSCHTDKRGPWIHEHPPVEENCAICHTPHGSAHKGLLAQKPPALCSDCHAERPYARHLRRARHAARHATVEHPLRCLRLRELSSADPRQQRAGVRLRRILPPLRPGDDHEIQAHCHSRGRPLCATRVRRRELHVGRIRRGRWPRHEHQRCQPQRRVWQHRTAFGHQPADAVRRTGGRRQGAGVPEHQQRADRRDRHPRWQQRLLPARLRRGVRPR